jgi:Ser/Thr protein kinase RdoA (MazF antagonist)
MENLGFEPNGYLTQLNSYENRVFSIDCENDKKVVAKFYRPGRWSKDAIMDEHNFLFELVKEGIPAVAPLKLFEGESLSEWDGMWVTVFDKMRGRSPDELLEKDFERIGRRLAQFHNVGARSVAKNRLSLFPSDYCHQAFEVLEKHVSPEYWRRYREVAENIFVYLEDELEHEVFLRIHGDCHKGNLIWNGEEFYFVDLDDCLNGPAVQDIWMLTQGEEKEIELLLNGYKQLRSFDDEELRLVEPLRALRMIYYSAWIAKRWEDPSFPKLFPHYATNNYWVDELDRLERIGNSI